MKPKVSPSLFFIGEVTLSLCVKPLPHTMVFTDMLGSTCIGKSPMPQHMNHVDNLINGLRVSESTSSLLSEGPDDMKTRPCHIQGRSLSECSVDSEDSFIVFHESPGTLGYGWSNEDADCYDLSDSSSDEEAEDDEMCIIQGSNGELNGIDSDAEDDDDTVQDTCDGLSQRVEEVNQRWQLENPPTVLKRKSDVLRKQVCFAPPETLQTVHPIIAWDYAYRASRIGPWEEMARDRARFRTRIERMEAILAPVLSQTHRKRMLERRDELAPSVSKCDVF